MMRLNLGSGPAGVDGWINIDRSPNVLLDRLPAVKRALFRVGVLDAGHMAPWSRDIVRRDLRRRLPYETGSVDAIYSSHTLEHLYFNDAARLISECHRVLRTGGVLRLALPDAEVWASEFLEGVAAGTPGVGRRLNDELLAHPYEPPKGLRAVVARGAGHVHRWQPSVPLVRDLLIEAGFAEIERREYRSGRLPGLAEVETRPESFFLEAVR